MIGDFFGELLADVVGGYLIGGIGWLFRQLFHWLTFPGLVLLGWVSLWLAAKRNASFGQLWSKLGMRQLHEAGWKVFSGGGQFLLAALVTMPLFLLLLYGAWEGFRALKQP